MDEEKLYHDLWQKCNILSKDENLSETDMLAVKRLKFVLVDQTIVKNPSLCEPYEDLYLKTFDEYALCFQKNEPKIFDINNEALNDLDFNFQFNLPQRKESSNSDTKTIQNENIVDLPKENENKYKDFKTANNKIIENRKRNFTIQKNTTAPVKKTLGGRGRFISPISANNEETEEQEIQEKTSNNEDVPEIKGVDKKLVELILNDVVDKGAVITWNDIAGLEFAKKTIEEIIIWPMVRPDLFTGLLIPVKGLLLFGPPGTGKTLIGKCIANQCNAKFFSISASSLTSKWFGEGEKLVRALFEVAKFFQPSVVFMDEVDSLLTARKDSEHESTRRIKTEFLVQLDGCGSNADDRILIIGATNRPQELDDAARRRFVKRLYVPLPDDSARRQIIENLIRKQSNDITSDQTEEIIQKTSGYSGADMMNLCKEAALGPIRDIKDITTANINDVRPIGFQDFSKALKNIKPSVGPNDIDQFVKWNDLYGCCSET